LDFGVDFAWTPLIPWVCSEDVSGATPPAGCLHTRKPKVQEPNKGIGER